ncbi:hypothetical protein CK203_110464 [Vitis vinifera]|uniref:Uncharacterized protein n=1 Tax=Vitis vinifera TaxID=29760 RepID=A0A438CJU3_VITVI|nr:hypothetical protein CK203_110464 [Vitis vinifera]
MKDMLPLETMQKEGSLMKREDDDLGLETFIGRLQIEDRRQQEENGEDHKKEESPLELPPPQQVQGESSQNLPKEWKFVINQAKYIRDLLKRFNMEEAKTMKTPMSSSIKLDKDEKDFNLVLKNLT